jgi:hypothetical protein
LGGDADTEESVRPLEEQKPIQFTPPTDQPARTTQPEPA